MKADMESGRWRTGYSTVNGSKLFWRDWRPREEHYLPVLALHGSLTQSGMWIGVAEGAGTIRMLCPDQRGFGRSEDPGGDACAEFAADALALAQDLLPGRCVVMAHSFACSIALEIARKAAAQVAALVLVDPVVRVGKVPAAAAPSAPPPEAFATLEDAARHFRATEEGEWTDATLGRFVHDIMMRDGDSRPWRFPYTAARLRRLRAFAASPASDYELCAKAKDVRCPVLVFRGGMSKRFPPAAEPPFRAAFATEPKVVLCPTSGHFPSTTEPEILIEELKRFPGGLR
jgi:pimeloyl-ACP methyl ester carboxylesterase